MELLVIDKIEDKNKKARTIDELPAIGGWKTIMTTEPKFVPNEAVTLNLKENIKANIRLIDCVGYLIEDALGSKEGNKIRMVRTPWSERRTAFSGSRRAGHSKSHKRAFHAGHSGNYRRQHNGYRKIEVHRSRRKSDK